MNSNVRSVFAHISKRNKLLGVAVVAALAVTVSASTGLIHLPLPGANPSPLVSNIAPIPAETIAPLEALDRATEAVAERVTPAVVNIQVIGQQKAQMQSLDPNSIPAPFRQFFEGPFQNTPHPQTFAALGSGVIVSPDGYIVTNNHVVKDADKLQVTLHDQRTLPAKVVGTDPATDLAVVKIDASGLSSAAFGDSSVLRPGQTVIAIGDPLGMDFSVTRGIVSATNRNRSRSDGPDARGSFIQTDAPINHGNSGGPLVNSQGQVIGINTEMLSNSGASAGIGFAIPSNLVKSVAASLIKNGKVVRGYLGIQVTDLTPDVASSLNEPAAKGALVNQVNDGSPAQSAGLKPYDVITSFNGEKVSNGSDLQVVAGSAAPDSIAKVGILRDGKPMTVAVTMGNYANAPGNGTAVAAASGDSHGTPKLGITVSPLTPDLRSQMQVPDGVNGVVIDSVTPSGPAMMAGLGRGDIIEQVNQHPVTTVDGLRQQLDAAPAGRSVLLMVHRSSGNFIVPVRPQE